MRYCKNLRFTQNPDYNYLRGLFRGCLKRHNWEEDYEFDWSRQKSKLHLYSNAASPMCGKHSSEKYRFMLDEMPQQNLSKILE